MEWWRTNPSIVWLYFLKYEAWRDIASDFGIERLVEMYASIKSERDSWTLLPLS